VSRSTCALCGQTMASQREYQVHLEDAHDLTDDAGRETALEPERARVPGAGRSETDAGSVENGPDEGTHVLDLSDLSGSDRRLLGQQLDKERRGWNWISRERIWVFDEDLDVAEELAQTLRGLASPKTTSLERSWFIRHKVATGFGGLFLLLMVAGGIGNAVTAGSTSSTDVAATSPSATAPLPVETTPLPTTTLLTTDQAVSLTVHTLAQVSDIEHDIEVKLTVVNLTARRISAFRGVMQIVVTDVYSNQYEQGFTYDNRTGMAANEILDLTTPYTVKHAPLRYSMNEFIPAQWNFYQALFAKGSNYKATWVGSEVVFSDGSTIP
jgi:hypothetical protein